MNYYPKRCQAVNERFAECRHVAYGVKCYGASLAE
jgi:hypothetical protein